MERKFSFDDMAFVARSETVDDTMRVGIYDAWDECRLEAEYPAPAPKGKRRSKAGAVPMGEEQAIDDAIASFKRKVEDGEIDLA